VTKKRSAALLIEPQFTASMKQSGQKQSRQFKVIKRGCFVAGKHS
jgi:hypothetical protein